MSSSSVSSVWAPSHLQTPTAVRVLPSVTPNQARHRRIAQAGVCGPTGGAADPYTLADLQCYLNQFKPAHYSHGGREPLLYAVVLLLSVQPRGLLAFLAQVRP